jgi:hypothetical protein
MPQQEKKAKGSPKLLGRSQPRKRDHYRDALATRESGKSTIRNRNGVKSQGSHPFVGVKTTADADKAHGILVAIMNGERKAGKNKKRLDPHDPANTANPRSPSYGRGASLRRRRRELQQRIWVNRNELEATKQRMRSILKSDDDRTEEYQALQAREVEITDRLDNLIDDYERLR